MMKILGQIEHISLCVLILLMIMLSHEKYSHANTPETPLRIVNSCELDFDDNEIIDIAIYLESVYGYELIIILRHTDRLVTYSDSIVKKGNPNLYYMQCIEEDSFMQSRSASDDGKPHKYKTPGAYVRFNRPESSSWAYMIEKEKIRKIFISD